MYLGPDELDQLGPFGVFHVDQHDLPGGWTNMVLLNEEDDRIEPQYFYFPELGVRVLQEPDGVINFTGLHIHAASHPVYKDGVEPGTNIYTRGVLVNYPASRIMLPFSSFALGANPVNDIMRVNAEAQFYELVEVSLCLQNLF
jgi:hypothetical protein